VLAVCAALYWLGVWLECAGASVHKGFTRPVAYFMQVAALFPKAAENMIEYRAEAWYCAEHVFREIDVRPFFPLRANDKENRFDRAMHFYRHELAVMQNLDQYIVASQNARGAPIGGVRLLSLRIPLPPPGTVTERYTRKGLDEYPMEWRKEWYRTGTAHRGERCKEARGQKGA
jgi:hypothetical protein